MKVILTGGGTGGHVLPAVRIGKELQKTYGAELHFIGNGNFIEKKIAEKEHIPFYDIQSQGLEGKNILDKWGGFAVHNSVGTLQALWLLRKIKPSLIVATGGFVSAPVMAAGVLLNIPYIIHEQNSVVGKVNKLFLGKAKRVYTSIRETKGIASGTLVGNPVRFNEKRAEEGEKLIVLGGSGGSVYLNEFMMGFAKEHPNIPIILQAGEKYIEELKGEGVPPNLTIVGFCDLEEMYKVAKVIIARAGTGTLFEIANQCIPSVIVPLPTSADNHQVKNAEHFAAIGGVRLVEQSEGDEKIEEAVLDLWNHEKKRKDMIDSLEKHELRKSEVKIAEDLISFFRK